MGVCNTATAVIHIKDAATAKKMYLVLSKASEVSICIALGQKGIAMHDLLIEYGYYDRFTEVKDADAHHLSLLSQLLIDSKEKRDKAFSYTWREFIDGVSFDENTNAIMIKYRCDEDAAEEYLNYISTHSSIATISEIELDEYNYEM